MIPRARRLGLFACFLFVFAFCEAENTVEPPEDVENFHPVRMYPAVAKFAGQGAWLLEFEARYVRSDGSMDLTADYFPGLEYEFVRPKARPADKPIGAGGGKTHEIVEIDVRKPGWRSVTRKSGMMKQSYAEYHNGMELSSARDVDADRLGDAAPPPACELAAVWKEAMTRAGAPAEAVAVIEYDREGYRFSITDLKIRRHLGHDCRMVPVLSAEELRDERKQLRDRMRAGEISRDEYKERIRAMRRR